MIRTMLVAVVAGLTMAAVRSATPNTCQLLTVQDASALAGTAVTLTASHDDMITCVYGGGGTAVGVEITVRTYPDAAAAHAAYPTWVMPYPTTSPLGPTVTALTNVGDEASLKRSRVASGVYFRHGAVLVKIGAHPPVADAALKAAATVVLGRL